MKRGSVSGPCSAGIDARATLGHASNYVMDSSPLVSDTIPFVMPG